jgi:glycosyltransferase involved in cell wall biosynthesis
MRIVMLGWEFPPFIAGGLGVACYGLTRALDRRGQEILFVLPRPVDRSHASHVRLFSPEALPGIAPTGQPGPQGELVVDPEAPHWSTPTRAGVFEHTRFFGVPASFRNPYGTGKAVHRQGPRGDLAGPDTDDEHELSVEEMTQLEQAFTESGLEAPAHQGGAGGWGKSGAGHGYRGDLYAESERYARLVVALLRGEKFDVIHAHDWLTFPAGQALARVSGRPLVVHIHSTEFDRSGDNINQRVYDIERRGMHSAIRVVCVSELTKSICTRRYGIDPARCDVVYNGIDSESAQPQPGERINPKDRIVLFLGRLTMQKGPEYFIAAAKRVLEKVPEAKFIVAGSGDMELRMIELAANLGIGHRVLFTGFLRGGDVDRVYQMADCYVMPSVSEPFGIAPLEAMRNDVPVIISKQSGVSEVLTHALKVDFWDIDEMANKIVAVLRHPPLGQTLRQHGSFELRRLTWDGAAKACIEVYEKCLTSAALPVR